MLYLLAFGTTPGASRITIMKKHGESKSLSCTQRRSSKNGVEGEGWGGVCVKIY